MIILNIKVIFRPELSIQQLANIIRDEFLADEGKLISTGIIQVAGEDDLICLKLEQDALTEPQRDWLHLSHVAARYIDSYEVDTNPIDTETMPTLESWAETKREMEDLRQRVRVLEHNNYSILHKRLLDFFNGMDLPQAPQQPTIDADTLREHVYSAESQVQRAIDALEPIHHDSVLRQVMIDLNTAMDAILEIREMIPEE